MEYERFGPEGAYSCRRLGAPDLAALQELFVRASDYFETATGAPPPDDEASRAFVAGPPNKSVDDKRTIGFFDAKGTLVGVIDALIDWPEESVWSVGMLLFDPGHRGLGLGSSALEALERWSGEQGARKLRTAVVSHHVRGIEFAERAGFRRDTVLDNYNAGARQASVIFLEKELVG